MIITWIKRDSAKGRRLMYQKNITILVVSVSNKTQRQKLIELSEKLLKSQATEYFKSLCSIIKWIQRSQSRTIPQNPTYQFILIDTCRILQPQRTKFILFFEKKKKTLYTHTGIPYSNLKYLNKYNRLEIVLAMIIIPGISI